ncbi:MAG: tannase/feruloyl esterase family alpha/beta hydrolase [Sphingomonas taxi]
MRMSINGVRWALALILSALFAAAAFPAGADVTAPSSCDGLRVTDFSKTRDAPFMVTSVRLVENDGPVPYCRAQGYVMPEISFEMRLPITGWNHGFVLVGSGGWANRMETSLCAEPLSKGYACLAGDAGHHQRGGLWMQSNPQAKIDWGYRATHVKAIAGKAIAASFYGNPPVVSLMIGCSTGGYQGLVEAQRFPWDFAGIVAIAPDIDEGDLSMRTAWAARQLVGADGRPTFAAADLAVLHRAALAACDMTDNARDGIVGDPLACRFDLHVVECDQAKTSDCLTRSQVEAAARIYSGPTTSGGQRISTAGPFPGSELMWPDILEDVSFAQDFFRFALADLPRDGFPANNFDFDEDYKRLGLGGTFISSNPDLRRFDQAGGKLIIVQGGNDVTEQAHAVIDYYQMVERVSGASQKAQRFARLFVVPGMNHCSGGDGAFAVGWFAAMERWVKEAKAPDMLVASHVPAWEKGSAGIEAGMTAAPPGEPVTFTRPVYPYPLYARYRGRGDVNDAASFEAAISHQR